MASHQLSPRRNSTLSANQIAASPATPFKRSTSISRRLSHAVGSSSHQSSPHRRTTSLLPSKTLNVSNSQESTVTTTSSASSASSTLLPTSSATVVPTKITVSVRLKPSVFSQQQQQQSDTSLSAQNQASWSSTATSITSPSVGAFTFDHVFDDKTQSRHVYLSAARNVVTSVVDGYHGTIFAYGMTGTGKTYSMQGTTSEPGIIPQAISDIFAHVSQAEVATNVSVSYLEIYNERIRDLLHPSTPSDTLKLQETPAGLVRVRNLRCVRVATQQELKDLILKGDLNRRTEGTEYNAVSSRSHAVLQIFLERSTDVLGVSTATSVLSLCDLAGSERAASDAERRKEGAYINRSLLALGIIIARLSSSSSLPSSLSASSEKSSDDQQYIPYRDSKLTRLLQHSLSGAALVSVLCTVDTYGSSRQALAETVNTLRFAARAKNVAITPARTVASSNSTSSAAAAAATAAAQAMIEELRLDLERERAETEILKLELADVRRETCETRLREQATFEQEKRELEMQRDAMKDKVDQLTRLILRKSSSSSEKRTVSVGVPGQGDISTTENNNALRRQSMLRMTSNSYSQRRQSLLASQTRLASTSELPIIDGRSIARSGSASRQLDSGSGIGASGGPSSESACSTAPSSVDGDAEDIISIASPISAAKDDSVQDTQDEQDIIYLPKIRKV
ncbi:kinesin motor domain-containing protein [Lipomyces oligophaga]|uniref:kinesin motor domain-containing protein n=1 Tax=Lipomyces oligophaga TaxID=45792 RepID=UPI0034CD1191